MNSIALLIAAAALGVEAGWEPLAEGGHEYTVQIEPALVARLQSGNDLLSNIPPQIDIRRLRIKIGTGALARVDGTTPGGPSLAAPDDAVADTPGDNAVDSSKGPEMPANFVDGGADAQPLTSGQKGAAPEPQPHSAEKPRLDAGSASPIPGITEPWVPFVIAVALLACSIGLNAYLGLVARSARTRYLNLVQRTRTASP